MSTLCTSLPPTQEKFRWEGGSCQQSLETFPNAHYVISNTLLFDQMKK